MSWQSLVLVPGLIAAGAGLLFGINAFTLDSSGAVWLSTLPNWATWAFASKMIVFAEVALAAVSSALIGGSLRAPAAHSSAEVTAAIASAICCATIVVAIGMRSSVRFPYRADLRGPRDTPATPGVMAAQSIRFAVVTTFTSLLFGAMSLTGVWWLPFVGAVPVIVACTLHLRATADAWAHPHVRAHVVLTVAGG
jgi:glucan phosphoethanolaminetransferase (alkaline phosphatase superfamily)